MTINVPYRVRIGLYIFTALGSPVIGYLVAKGTIGELELALWMAEVSAVNALAAFNVKPNNEEK